MNSMLPATFVSTDFTLGAKHEILVFVNRCVGDIESGPESMQAGLSSLLLSTIAQSCSKMQIVIAKEVFIRLLQQLLTPACAMNKRVAFLSVLASLLNNAGAQF